MKLGQKQELFTENLAKLISFANTMGFKARLREVQRTDYQQAEYLRKGLSKSLNSQHLKSLAADIYFTENGRLIQEKQQLKVLGDYWESLNIYNRWGGNFRTFQDCPHFEMRG